MTKDGTLLIEPQLERATSHFQKAIKFNPENYRSYYELGILLSEKEQFQDAFDCLQKSIFINGNFAEGHYQLAVLLMNESAQLALSSARTKGSNKSKSASTVRKK